MSFKILGSEDPVTTNLGNMTQGLGFPLRPVEPGGAGQPLIAGIEQVLGAESTVTQLIGPEDTPQAVVFDSSVDNDALSLDAATGLITIKEEGVYTLRLRLQVGRTSNNGVAWIITRTQFNGAFVGSPIPSLIDDNDFSMPLTFEDSAFLPAGDTIQFFIYRDSQESSAGDAGLFAYGTTLWGQTASARCTITRVVSQEAP